LRAEELNQLITRGSIPRALLRTAWPAVLMMLAVMLFEIVDMYWLGRGPAAWTTAIAAATYVVWTVKALAMLAANGSQSLISQNAGQQNWQRSVYWLQRGLLLALLLGLVIALLSAVLMAPMLQLMALSPQAAGFAADYLEIIFLSLPLIFAYAVFDSFFRALGDTRTTSLITVVALLTNVLLDPLLIYGYLGLPRLGMAGAAWASLFAHLLAVLLFTLIFSKRRLPAAGGFRRHGISADFLQIIRIGYPLALSGALFSLVYIFLTRIVARAASGVTGESDWYGHAADLQIAAMGIGQRWESLAYYFCLGFSFAVATLVGQNLGLGQVQRARQAALLATRILLLFTSIISLLFVFFGYELAYFLVPNHTQASAAAAYLFAVGVFQTTMAFEFGLEGAFVGAGDTLPPFLISFPLTFARIPIAWLFAVHWQMGITAVWWTIAFTMLAKGLLFAIWFYRGRWLRQRLQL
jgi:putative MATE family efflux protein